MAFECGSRTFHAACGFACLFGGLVPGPEHVNDFVPPFVTNLLRKAVVMLA